MEIERAREGTRHRKEGGEGKGEGAREEGGEGGEGEGIEREGGEGGGEGREGEINCL